MKAMKVTGKVTHIGAVVAAGKYHKQTIAIEVEGEKYNDTLAFVAFGERALAEAEKVNFGDIVEVEFYPRSREWEGKFFTDLNLWSVEIVKGGYARPEEKAPVSPSELISQTDESDDLPFEF